MLMNKPTYALKSLEKFIIEAAKNTYAAGADPVPNPERPDFYELVYFAKDFSYRDSYTGHYRSRGMEVVRLKDLPVWSAAYGGGIVAGKEDLTTHCFQFLQKALAAKDNDPQFLSFRGPQQFQYGDWKYDYEQSGDIEEFWGYEEISYKGELIFYHRIIGGTINHYSSGPIL